MESEGPNRPTPQEVEEESRRVRRLRILVNLALGMIAQGGVTLEEAWMLVANTRQVAAQLFPGKESTFDLIYRPQFERMIREVYRT